LIVETKSYPKKKKNLSPSVFRCKYGRAQDTTSQPSLGPPTSFCADDLVCIVLLVPCGRPWREAKGRALCEKLTQKCNDVKTDVFPSATVLFNSSYKPMSYVTSIVLEVPGSILIMATNNKGCDRIITTNHLKTGVEPTSNSRNVMFIKNALNSGKI